MALVMACDALKNYWPALMRLPRPTYPADADAGSVRRKFPERFKLPVATHRDITHRTMRLMHSHSDERRA